MYDHSSSISFYIFPIRNSSIQQPVNIPWHWKFVLSVYRVNSRQLQPTPPSHEFGQRLESVRDTNSSGVFMAKLPFCKENAKV